MNQNNLLKKALQDISRSEALSENDIRQKIRLAVSLALKSKDPKTKIFGLPFHAKVIALPLMKLQTI